MAVIPVYEGREPYIFVSYSHRDSGTVLPVVSGLYEDRYRVWYDEGIAPGSEWPHNIAVHLEHAAVVAAFISDNSRASINCENEIVRAAELGKDIIVYQVDGSDHELLRDCPHAGDADSLKALLSDSLIGDGVTGYGHSGAAGGRSIVWDLVLGAALVLVAVLAAGLFGLSRGWFDDYLPGRQSLQTEAAQAEEESAETIDNDVLAEAILSQIGKDELMKEISIDDKEAYDSFCAAAGSDGDLTYFDLTNDRRESISIEKGNDEVLGLLKYFPQLRTAQIKSGDISSLGPAAECPKLEKLSLGFDIFPVDIPEDIRFEIEAVK